MMIMTVLFGGSVCAEDVKVLIPTLTDSNYTLYRSSTGMFISLDTRYTTIDAIEPTPPKKSKVLNSEPLTSDAKAVCSELYPTDISWKMVLFDKIIGDMRLLN